MDRYADAGYAVFPGLVPPDLLRRLIEVTDRLLAGAAALDADDAVLELDDGHSRARPRVRRIKKPHRHDPAYREAAACDAILDLVAGLIGPDIRLNHSKVNTKDGTVGAAIEWHQDWAFAPHTNMDCCVAAVLLDDVGPDSGPMLVLPGSHRLGLMDHHQDGLFVGAVDVGGLDMAAA